MRCKQPKLRTSWVYTAWEIVHGTSKLHVQQVEMVFMKDLTGYQRNLKRKINTDELEDMAYIVY